LEAKNKPVLITDVVKGWKAYKRWSLKDLESRYGDIDFQVGGNPMKMKDFFTYMEHPALQDDQPLYLFDQYFEGDAPDIASEYMVPKYFDEDLFSVCGKERPDYRWIIIGPARSGSTFHIDPNATSAWNAVIKGRKKWVMFPPGQVFTLILTLNLTLTPNPVQVPPGIRATEDGAEVTAPVSLTEWFHQYYSSAMDLPEEES